MEKKRNIVRTYKRKLKLTKLQEQRIFSWIGTCRLVYNMGLEIKNDVYRSKMKSVHKYELMKQITELRKEYKWIADVPCESLQKTIEILDNSFNKFFNSFRKGGGYPKFKSKKDFKSICFKSLNISGSIVTLPKIGKLRIFKDEKITGIPKTACIKIEPTGIFITIQCENAHKRFDSENQSIGIDMGISNFCVDSKGGFIHNPKHFKKYENRLRIENRSLSRKKKGSNSWVRQSKKIALLYHKISNVRNDFLQKESTKIAKQNSVVYMEKLNIPGMAKNHNLSKHILDCGWGRFKDMLEYKTTVIKVDPKYTSQNCNKCGQIDKKSRINQAEYICTSCGYVSNADVNAAINIKSKGIAIDRQREPLGCA